MINRPTVFQVLLLCASVPLALAESRDFVDLHGVRLRLGMTKSEVVSTVSKNAQVHQWPKKGNMMCVAAKDIKFEWAENYNDCDLLFFSKDDRLGQITKRQGGTTDEMAARMVRNLFTILRDAAVSGIPINVTALPEQEAPELRSGTIVFKIGPKEYNLGVLQPIGKSSIASSSVGLGEVLSVESANR